MAGTNKLIKFSTFIGAIGTYDTYTDDALVGLADKQGIVYGSVAKTNILNGMLRQLTFTNKELGDLIVEKVTPDFTLETTLANGVYKGYIETAIENIAKEVTVTRLTAAPTVDSVTITADTTKSGITINTDGLVKSIVSLSYSDLPSVAQYTFLGRTESETGSVSALSRDSLLGISTNGFIKRSDLNTYTVDTNTYAIASTVALKQTDSPITPTFWVGSESQYLALTPDSNVIYFIV